ADTGALRTTFDAYVSGFRGGVRVASGFFNGDTIPDVVTAAGPGGGPHVRVFDGATGNVILEFFAYAATFTGGVYVAAGDFNADGVPDIVTGPGLGGGPHVEVFDGRTGAVLVSTQAFVSGGGSGPWLSGARVAVLDFNLDGIDDIVVSPG